MDKIAIPSNGGGGLTEKLSTKFARCESFTFIEIEDKEIKSVKTIPNSAINTMGSAGIEAARFIGMNNANTVIIRKLGKNAAKELAFLKIRMMEAPDDLSNVKDIIDSFIKGTLKEIYGANI